MEAKEKKQPTCEELIDDRLANRLDQWLPDFDEWEQKECDDYATSVGMGFSTDPEYFRDEDGTLDEDAFVEALVDECREHFRDYAHENILAITKTETYRIELSYGGPQDYFTLEYDRENRCWEGGRYHYLDWFDGATRSINAETAELLAEAFGVYVDN